MDAQRYSDLALRTNGTTGDTNNLVHAALGMSSEASEIMDAIGPVNVLEEAGDALWFLNLAVRSMAWNFAAFVDNAGGVAPMDAHTARVSLAYCAGIACDLVKKQFAYGKSFDGQTFAQAAHGYAQALYCVLYHEGLNLQQAMAGNVAKLEKRYPNLTFDADHATNRNKAAELEAMSHAAAR